MNDAADYVTINEAAAMLAVSPSYIKKCIHTTRILPALTIPGSRVIRIRRADVHALLRAV